MPGHSAGPRHVRAVVSGWANSDRRARLPADWPKRRAAVKRRARGRCEWVENGVRCLEPGTDCDHVTPDDDHSLGNLQWLCGGHHERKTIAERPKREPRNRPAPRHPGLLGG